MDSNEPRKRGLFRPCIRLSVAVSATERGKSQPHLFVASWCSMKPSPDPSVPSVDPA